MKVNGLAVNIDEIKKLLQTSEVHHGPSSKKKMVKVAMI